MDRLHTTQQMSGEGHRHQVSTGGNGLVRNAVLCDNNYVTTSIADGVVTFVIVMQVILWRSSVIVASMLNWTISWTMCICLLLLIRSKCYVRC